MIQSCNRLHFSVPAKRILLFAVLIIGLFINGTKPDVKCASIAQQLVSIIRYIQWPDKEDTVFFKIGVVGDFQIYKEIVKETKDINIHNVRVDVINMPRIENMELTDLNMLVLSADNSSLDQIQRALGYIGSNPTLLITEAGDALKRGSGINFIESNGRVAFEINKTNATRNGMKLSHHLEVFAISVVD